MVLKDWEKLLLTKKKKYSKEECICCHNIQYYDKKYDIAVFGYCNCDENYGTEKCKHYKLKKPNKFVRY